MPGSPELQLGKIGFVIAQETFVTFDCVPSWSSGSQGFEVQGLRGTVNCALRPGSDRGWSGWFEAVEEKGAKGG
jgi:hypothetical protein